MPVKHNRLGAHGALVCNLWPGTMNFGRVTTEEDGFGIMDRAPELGRRTLEQLDSAVRATEIRLDGDAVARLDEIFPGPGGQALETHAW